MPITITKPKTKTKAAVNSGIDVLVQRYVENRLALEGKMAKLAALQKEVATDEKDLLQYTDTLVDATEGTELQAGDYVVKIGPKGRKAVAFDKGKIKQEIGDHVYEQIATFAIEDLRKYMTGHAFDEAVTYENVSKRKIVIEEAKDQ